MKQLRNVLFPIFCFFLLVVQRAKIWWSTRELGSQKILTKLLSHRNLQRLTKLPVCFNLQTIFPNFSWFSNRQTCFLIMLLWLILVWPLKFTLNLVCFISFASVQLYIQIVPLCDYDNNIRKQVYMAFNMVKK